MVRARNAEGVSIRHIVDATKRAPVEGNDVCPRTLIIGELFRLFGPWQESWTKRKCTRRYCGGKRGVSNPGRRYGSVRRSKTEYVRGPGYGKVGAAYEGDAVIDLPCRLFYDCQGRLPR